MSTLRITRYALPIILLMLALFTTINVANADTPDNRSIDQSVNQPTAPASNQPTTPSINQSVNQSVNQSANQVSDDDHIAFMVDADAGAPTQTSGLGLFARTIGALALILGLLIAGVWGLKRLGHRGVAGAAAANLPLNLLATISLGEHRTITMVRFNDRVLLLGATAQSINLLASQQYQEKLEASAALLPVAELLRQDSERDAGAGIDKVEQDNFAQQLARFEREFDFNGDGYEK